MKILMVHNYYQQPGGEDQVFAAETHLLQSRGHRVIQYTLHNKQIDTMHFLQLAPAVFWNRTTYRELLNLARKERPDVAHVHNTFPLVSPAAYFAFERAGVAVVQSLHNPRLICPSANFYRTGHLCTLCLGRSFAWPGVLRGCYRGSRVYTLGVAATVGVHKLLGTWHRMVDQYIVFTEFYKNIFLRWGIPPEKISVKPHFVDPAGLDVNVAGQLEPKGDYFLFVGRLDPEKGVRTLIRTWKILEKRQKSPTLKIRGEGQLFDEVKKETVSFRLPIEFIGRLSRKELLALMRRAQCLIWPSEGYYENFGLVAIEAFACGTPVIASGIGVATSIVENGRTGLLFRPGDPEDLAAKVEWAWTHPKQMAEMGRGARREYEAKYTAERNYEMLMEIYRMAIDRARGRR